MTAAALITCPGYLGHCASLNFLNGDNSDYLRYAPLLMSFRATLEHSPYYCESLCLSQDSVKNRHTAGSSYYYYVISVV